MLGGECVGSEAQVFHQRFLRLLALHVLRLDADQAVELAHAQHLGVLDGFAHAVLEFADAVRVAGNAALARIPLAGRQVVQHQVELEAVQAVRDLVRVKRIGKQEFHAAEARARGGFEAVEKTDFVEQHGEVCRKFGHESLRFNCGCRSAGAEPLLLSLVLQNRGR